MQLVGLRGLYGVSVIALRTAECKANAHPAVLLLWPLDCSRFPASLSVFGSLLGQAVRLSPEGVSLLAEYVCVSCSASHLGFVRPEQQLLPEIGPNSKPEHSLSDFGFLIMS